MSKNALFSDYYEFTMLRAYHELDMTAWATFSLFVRNLPPGRNFLLACGLADLLDEIASLRFGPEDISQLATLGDFPTSFLDSLSRFRFTGDIFAMREGTPFFPHEPILEISAPIAEAQFIETLVLNQISLQTILASKAARVVAAARGRHVSDFGARRAQGRDAAIKGVRAFYIAGVKSTSNVAGALIYGVPLTGTMAHSFIEACDSEEVAFQNFTNIFPEATLLVDTYDTIAGVKKAIALARSKGTDHRLHAVRLDSGDLEALSKATRALLDEAGLPHVRIVASGGLHEAAIDSLMSRDAPIDVFGVGTEMVTSSDAPALDIAYKLTEYAGTPRMKLSVGKPSLPGRKQVFRELRNGVAVRDVIAVRDEELPGDPLLHPVMLAGRRIEGGAFSLADIRDFARRAMETLPADLKTLASPTIPYEVAISAELSKLERRTRKRLQMGPYGLRR